MARRIGILVSGMCGAVANTLIAGTLASSKLQLPDYGMITESFPFSKLHFPDWKQFRFSGWDLNNKNAFESANEHGILPMKIYSSVMDRLISLSPMIGVTGEPDYYYPTGDPKRSISHADSVERLKEDIRKFKAHNSLDEVYVVNLTSPPRAVIESPGSVGKHELLSMVNNNSPLISGSIIYALAAIEAGSGFIDFTSSQALELKGIWELAEANGVPLAGKDGATGETALKASLAEFFGKRNLRLSGWFSTNILGNNDGRVLREPAFAATKLQDKSGILPEILGYTDFQNSVSINYYPPRGDNKEAWNVIDFLGWIGMDMTLRLDWCGRDSILAAPLVLDLVRHLDFARSKGDSGVLKHLGLYFKRPIGGVSKGLSEAYGDLLRYYSLY